MVVYPSVNIGVSVSVVNLTFTEGNSLSLTITFNIKLMFMNIKILVDGIFPGNLEIDINTVVLNTTNPEVCIVVYIIRFPSNNQQCDGNSREFVVGLSSRTDPNSRYSVNILQENITISIDDCK